MSTNKIYGLSVGICHYQNLRALNCATNDAKDIASAVHEGITRSELKILLDADATKRSILDELGWLAATAGTDDTVIVFFSGHGGRSASPSNEFAFLCPVNASPIDIEQSCITGAELTEIFGSIKSARLVVFLDTCYSGGIGELESRDTSISWGLTSRDVASLVQGNGRMVLGASSPNELAWESKRMRNGHFTGYLLRALRGEVSREDGSIWAADLFSFVSRGLSKHQMQRPYQKAIGHDFVILVRKSGVRLPAPVARQSLSPLDQRMLRVAMRGAYNRDELSLLCHDLGLSLEDLPGRTLETQLMDLIDHCHRHGLYSELLEQVQRDRPQLIEFR